METLKSQMAESIEMVRRDRAGLLSRLSQESAQEVSGAIKKLVGGGFQGAEVIRHKLTFCPG